MCLVWLKICSPPWIRALQFLLQRAFIQCSSCAWLAWTNSGNQFWKRIFFLWINIYIPTIFGGMDIQKSRLQLGRGDPLSQMAPFSGFNRGAEADADGIAPLPRLRTADYAVDVGEVLIEEALLRNCPFLHQEGGPWISMYIIASCIGQCTKDGKGIKGFGKWTWWYPSRPNGLSSFSPIQLITILGRQRLTPLLEKRWTVPNTALVELTTVFQHHFHRNIAKHMVQKSGWLTLISWNIRWSCLKILKTGYLKIHWC